MVLGMSHGRKRNHLRPLFPPGLSHLPSPPLCQAWITGKGKCVLPLRGTTVHYAKGLSVGGVLSTAWFSTRALLIYFLIISIECTGHDLTL